MSNPDTVAVVLAGGRGTRLYPASSPETPKQFRAVGGERSLLERTVARAERFADEVVVLTRPAYADRVRGLVDAEVFVEPEPKDTGPALVYAAHRLRGRAETLVCLPSDHHVGDDAAFATAAERAAATARETGGLVTMGVEPTRPATGYGYLKPGEARGEGVNRVEAFVEKPDAETAARYREAGYRWNAGIFAWTPAALLRACEGTPLEPLVDALDAGDPEPFAACEAVSVDYGVMEDAEDVYLVAVSSAWDDLGTWDALARVLDADESGTVVDGNALPVDAEGCVLATDEGSHVAAVGVSDLVVAAYEGRVLVVPKAESQRVREVWDAVYGEE
ncbi:sugar phosphate nucleotidyltransferase [Salinirubellus salinus]|uniref:Sugar phosphate nucleotidyltransferase n=1 Tax=Salinirubellus salinus TaxID=1364945 RepID=A0A9E7R6C9_9EURY|nr:sugar phosphate nucleotidyltransferase [Salinirubellus salinus]UWM56735.1 sugar phosphate nucleotidyltransferase [Salinirubellus salinus]